MWVIVKRTICRLLSLLGIGVYRLLPGVLPFEVGDPIRFNTQERADQLWSNDEIVKFYLSPARLKFYDDLVNLTREKGIDCNGKHIADVGCGTGHILFSISKTFHPLSMTGLDYSREVIAIARTVVPEAKFYYHDIYESSKEYGFDVVFCMEVLEHLLLPNEALRNLTAMMNRPGVAVITVPNGP